MAGYGTDTNIEYMVWGGLKASVPPVVTKANQIMTSMINAALGLSANMSTVPQIILDACELGAAGIVKQGSEKELHPWTKQALNIVSFYKNDLTKEQIGNWGNIRTLNVR